MTSEKKLAALMKRLRVVRGLSTTDAGKLLGLSRRTIESIEQGRDRSRGKVLELALERLIEQRLEGTG